MGTEDPERLREYLRGRHNSTVLFGHRLIWRHNPSIPLTSSAVLVYTEAGSAFIPVDATSAATKIYGAQDAKCSFTLEPTISTVRDMGKNTIAMILPQEEQPQKTSTKAHPSP